jgi:hypothetical protein
VLIAAIKGEQQIRECSLAVLSEPNVEFWYSPILRLEVTLQPAHNRRRLELAFLQEYFSSSSSNCFGDLDRMFAIAEPEAIKHGIPVIDALHIAAANLSKCSVLVTTEKPSKPLFRTKLVKVVSIDGVSIHRDMSQRVRGLLGI